MRRAIAVGRGLLLAVPALLVFGALLAAADAIFADLLARVFAWDLGAVISHGVLTLILAWVLAGYLRAAARNTAAPDLPDAVPGALRLGAVEVGIVLGSLDARFLLFVAVQLRYLFGGAAWVAASPPLSGQAALTYAEYARRGFFELVTVAALALPLLLLLHWLLRPESTVDERWPRPEALFRLLAGAQLVLLGAVLASALQRMRLYQQAYGLTELRVYTTAFMAWIALVLVWFAATVLRGQRLRFAAGAVVAGALVLAARHPLNPDAIIVRANAAPAAAPSGRPFDAAYAGSLSADAVPALLAAWPAVPPAERCALARDLLVRWSDPDHDWRRWSWVRASARQAVHAHEQDLRSCRPVPADRLPTPDDP